MQLAFLDRPWGLVDGGTTQSRSAAPRAEQPVRAAGCVGWLYTDAPDNLTINARPNVCCREFSVGKEWIYAIPVPLRDTGVLTAAAGDRELRLDLSALPERPQEDLEPANQDQMRARSVLDRVKSVWARLRDVEVALADPERIWLRLTELWLSEGTA